MDVSRRGFLRFGAAAGAALATAPAKADPGKILSDFMHAVTTGQRDETPLKYLAPANLANTMTVLAKHNDMVLAGDSDHTSGNIRKVMASDEFLGGFKAGGGQLLVLEMPTVTQPVLDRFMQSPMRAADRKTFIDGMCANVQLLNEGADAKQGFFSDYADIVTTAKRHGLAVAFGDNGRGIADEATVFTPEEIRFMQSINQRAMAAWRAQGHPTPHTDKEQGDFQRYRQVFYKEKLDSADRDRLPELGQKFLAARTDDRELGEHIAGIAAGRKTLVVYGSQHTDPMNMRGLDEVLGRNRDIAKLTMLTHVDREVSMRGNMNRYYGREEGIAMPDVVIGASTGAAYLTYDGNRRYGRDIENQAGQKPILVTSPRPDPNALHTRPSPVRRPRR